MAIRLKDKIKKYFTEIWLLEIIIILLVGYYFCSELYKSINSTSYVKQVIDKVRDPSEVYKDDLEDECILISSIIYDKTDYYRLLYYGSDRSKEEIKSYFRYSPNFTDIYSINRTDKYILLPKGVYFIIRDKYTNEVISNDLSIQKSKYTQKEILDYIKGLYNGDVVSVFYDNTSSINKLLTKKGLYADEIMSNYEEYYYTSANRYNNSSNERILFFIALMALVEIILLIKIILVLIFKRKKIKFNTSIIDNAKLILANTFRYKETKKVAIGLIIGLVIFYLLYLYLMAVGGNNKNIIVNFFSVYPFKASFIVIILPVIVALYSIKKTIEIKKVTEALHIINQGNLKYDIPEGGASEIVELIDNINKIKNSYEVALEDTLKNEKLKTELITNVSHDLRTPLTSIINYVNILQRDNITNDERKDYLKILEKKSKKLKILIDDLFEMSKINSGKVELNKEDIDIISLIYQSIGEYSLLYEEKYIEFKVNSNCDEVIMKLDGKMISRAIENIVINSLKYSLEKTRVYVNIEKKDDSVEISFKNIANYDMDFDNEEIFERFVRADKSRASDVEGSGLGLAITKSIIECHNGSVKIKREGDMFKIYINIPL